MTYRELLYKATRLIDNNKITLGEYEEMTKPLDREVEQEPILDKIRAEIIEDCGYSKDYVGAFTYSTIKLKTVLQIIDKYKAESETEDGKTD